jgi:hypothetical protein
MARARSTIVNMSRLCVLALVLFASQNSYAWGQRGHSMICQVAAKLVQNPYLSSFLNSRGETMGHLCNIPDIYWKNLGAEGAEGDHAHFINPQNVGLELNQVPDSIRDYYAFDKVAEDSNAKHKKMGSLFWRSQQFYDRAVLAGKVVKTAPFPTDRRQEQDFNFAYNKKTLEFLINLGLMGHFVGDASMPFHTDADYDGYAAGHGGIHSFYEGGCVSYMDFAIAEEVFQRALEFRKNSQMTLLSPVAQPALTMTRSVAMAGSADRVKVLALDKVKVASTPNTPAARGQSAKRDSYEQACPAFRGTIVNELALSAQALANLWDHAFIDAGTPNFSRYRSFDYPFTPDFVGVDYLP